VQGFISYRVKKETNKTNKQNLATMLKTILPSLPQTVIIKNAIRLQLRILIYDDDDCYYYN